MNKKDEKKKLLYEKELERLDQLLKFENELYDNNFKLVAGIDEVGRGPLAGPVVAACVVLPIGEKIIGINDSKKLSEKKRSALYDEIIEKAMGYGIGVVDVKTIDEINILQASFLAMKKALSAMELQPDFILVDGNQCIPSVEIPQHCIVSGDCLSISIAAASIVAKVFRDGMMCSYHEAYPEYGFDKHKGYGTAVHIEALKKFGACSIHRELFIRKFITE